VQVFPDTESQPVQVEKTEFASGAAVRVTRVTGAVFATGSVQPAVDPEVQDRDVPGAVTVPLPVPPVHTVRRYVLGAKMAVTDFATVIETVQVAPDTLVQPDQDWKKELASGVAVSVTIVAGVVFAIAAVHPVVAPVGHEIPPMSLVMVPIPDPLARAVRVNVLGAKFAYTVRALVTVIVQV
jgi:hypothetical protein